MSPQFAAMISATAPMLTSCRRNIRRRHLTTEQRRVLIAKLLKAQPEKSNRTIAKQTKTDDKTVAEVRGGLEATAEIPQFAKRVGTDGKTRTTAQTEKPGIRKKLRDIEDPIAKTKAKEAAAKDADAASLAPQHGRSSAVQSILEAIEKLDDQQLAELRAALMQQWPDGLGVPCEAAGTRPQIPCVTEIITAGN